MTFATLSESSEHSRSRTTHVPLTVVFIPQIPNGSVWVREGLMDSHALSSFHKQTFERYWGRTLPHPVRIIRDNAFLADSDRQHLDEKGVVQPGTTLQTGDVLWSAVEARNEPSRRGRRATSEESSSPNETDSSERLPADWNGSIVLEADYNETKDSIAVSVTMQLEQALGLGDGLFCDESFIGVVSKILDEDSAEAFHYEADLFISAAVAEELNYPIDSPVTLSVAKSQFTAQQHVRSRTNGPYSLITQRPLNRNRFDRAQVITSAHANWLLSRKMRNLLAEFASLKCDEMGERTNLTPLTEGTIDRDEIPPPGRPLSRWLLEAEFFGMGLKLELDSTRLGQFQIRPVTGEEVVSASQGKVKKPETLNYRTYEGEPDGLFCPKIFADDVTRFGHLELASPIVPYWLHRDRNSLAELLSVEGNQLEELINHRSAIQFSGGEWIWSEPDIPIEMPENWLFGAEAVRALLDQVPSNQMPLGLRAARDSLVMDVLPVLPSPIRPLVLLDSGNFATSDLNDLYRRVINRNNRLAKLIELQAPPAILQNERRMLQYAADALFANGLLSKDRRVLGSNNRPLKSMMDLTLSRFTEPIQKPVVWSAQARGIIDTQLDSTTVEVPQHIFHELQLSTEQPILITHEDTEAFVAFYPRPTVDAILRLPEQPAKALGLPFVTDRFLSIHPPIRSEAIAEAVQLIQGSPRRPTRRGSADRPTKPDDLSANWMQSIWHAEPLSLDPGEAALHFGLNEAKVK